MSKKAIETNHAPAAIGPYSQGIATANLVFTSGQLPLDPSTNEFPQGIEAQARQSMKNVSAVLERGGSSMEKAIKLTIFLVNMDDFATVNEVYASFFESDFPARSVVEVSRLPKGASIEIEAIGLA